MKKAILWIISVSLFVACDTMWLKPTRMPYWNFHTKGYPWQDYDIAWEQDTLRAVWIKPYEGNKGVFVLFSGNAENMQYTISHNEWILNMGYSLFVYDYPGFGRSTGNPTLEGVRNSSLTFLRFADSVIARQAPELPVIVKGQSLGAGVAAKALGELQTRLHTKPSLFIFDGGFSSYSKMAHHHVVQTWQTWPLQFLVPYLVPAGSDAEAYARTLQIPQLVVGCTQDPVVPFALTVDYFNQVTAQKWMWRDDNCRHVDLYKNDTNAAQRFKAFLESVI
jgi:uncharacterized protein